MVPTLLPDRSTLPELRSGRLPDSTRDSIREPSGLTEPDRSPVAALSGAADREGSMILPEDLSGLRDDRLSEVDALSGAMEREPSTLLSEYPLEPELVLEEVTILSGRRLQLDV